MSMTQNTMLGQMGAAGAPDQNLDTSNNYDTRVITAAEAGDTITQLPTRIMAANMANFASLQPAGASPASAADPNDPYGAHLSPPAPLPLFLNHQQQQQAPQAPQAPQMQAQQPAGAQAGGGGGGGGVGGFVRRLMGSLRRSGSSDRDQQQQQQQQQQQSATPQQQAPRAAPTPSMRNRPNMLLSHGSRRTGGDGSGLGRQTSRQAIARAILAKASELPLPRRHELVTAAAADPALALVFTAGAEQPVPPVSDLDGRLDKLLKKVAKSPQPAQPQAPPQPQQQQAQGEGVKPQVEEEALTLRLVPEYESYGLGGEAVRAVVSVKAAAEVKQRAHVALTCVLDRSGSMAGSRIGLVRETCHFLIDQLTPDDMLGLVSYAGDVRQDVPLLRMTPAARTLAHALVDALDADGSTALYDGLAAGVEQQMEAEAGMKALAAAGGGGGGSCSRLVHSCFLFTDGEATDGPRDPASILAGLAALQAPTDQHVTVHTFGFGASHSVELLQAVADAQSGVYYYISCVDDIPSGFGDALGGLLAVVAKDVRVGVRVAPGVDLTAFRSGGRVVGGGAGSLASAAASAGAQGRARSAAQRRQQQQLAGADDGAAGAGDGAAAAGPGAHRDGLQRHVRGGVARVPAGAGAAAGRRRRPGSRRRHGAVPRGPGVHGRGQRPPPPGHRRAHRGAQRRAARRRRAARGAGVRHGRALRNPGRHRGRGGGRRRRPRLRRERRAGAPGRARRAAAGGAAQGQRHAQRADVADAGGARVHPPPVRVQPGGRGGGGGHQAGAQAAAHRHQHHGFALDVLGAGPQGQGQLPLHHHHERAAAVQEPQRAVVVVGHLGGGCVLKTTKDGCVWGCWERWR